MPGPNRGALPLALLILLVLSGGVVLAVMRIDEKTEQAGPGPTVVSPEPSPSTTQPSASPSTSASATSVSPSPTVESPTPSPTEESPTPKPSPTEHGGGRRRHGGIDGTDGTLAQTGGPLLPYFLVGLLMLAASAGLWRLRRSVD